MIFKTLQYTLPARLAQARAGQIALPLPRPRHLRGGPPDAHCGVKGDLEGGALVLGAHHGLELLGIHGALHLTEQRAHAHHLVLGGTLRRGWVGVVVGWVGGGVEIERPGAGHKKACE